MDQHWRDVTFIHWRYDADVIQRRLPDGLTVDVVDGSAWVSLTPFSVDRFRRAGLPPLPVVSRYPETNLRTYVRDRAGRDGRWSLSVDVASWVSVAAVRLAIGAPYHQPSRMGVDTDEGPRRGSAGTAWTTAPVLSAPSREVRAFA